MTKIQVDFWRLQEDKRHNRYNEAETTQSRLETTRHNKVTEAEAQRHDIMSERIDWAKLSEQNRHNIATENISERQLAIAEEQWAMDSKYRDLQNFDKLSPTTQAVYLADSALFSNKEGDSKPSIDRTVETVKGGYNWLVTELASGWDTMVSTLTGEPIPVRRTDASTGETHIEYLDNNFSLNPVDWFKSNGNKRVNGRSF